MYDKIKLFADRMIIGDSYTDIARYLDEAYDVTNRNTGECNIYGSLNGLKVNVYPNGVSVTGSFPKFLHQGSNIYPITRVQTKEAIDKVSDLLHFQVSESEVRTIEVGSNFVMKYKPQNYLFRLGDMPYLHRFQLEASTLYYKGIGRKQPKVFTLYDKISDAKNKKMEIPAGFENANVLRYEMRLEGRLKKQFHMAEIKASTLYDPAFYRTIVKKWQNSYYSISKNRLDNTDMNNIKTPKEAFKVFVAMLIAQNEESSISSYIEDLKQRNVFKHRTEYSRLRKMILDVSSNSAKVISDELIKELDNEVKNAGIFM